MKLKLKHLRHPLKTANAAKSILAARWNLWRFAKRGARQFANDPRYDLRNVTEGFAPRVDNADADTALLERICDSYIKATQQQQQMAPETYKATEWWEWQRKWSLQPVTQALTNRDFGALRRMYRNFYRDPCSAGLIVDQGLARNCFDGAANDFHRRLYLIDALYRIDYWRTRTDARFALDHLSGPAIGNPFGVVMEGTLVRAGADYHHYCAHRIGGLLDSNTATVVEIGGGFGGMAYYLLRDRPGITYMDFDVPESIALTSYYLLKAFPLLKFLLYGEEEMTKEAIARADVVLMPVFELAAAPAGCADVSFSSHAMSDLSPEALIDYLNDIGRMTRDHFVYIGNGPAGKAMSDVVDRQFHWLKLAELRSSGWHDHRVKGISVVEHLYRIRNA